MTLSSRNSTIDFIGKSGKPLLIILEGGDKVGKSSIYQLLRRRTNYQPLVIDRFIGSNFVYDKFYDRHPTNEPYELYYETERKLQEVFEVYMFLLYADPEDQRVRIEKNEKGPDLDKAISNYQQINEYYRQYLEGSPIAHKVLALTTGCPFEAVVEDIINYIRWEESG